MTASLTHGACITVNNSQAREFARIFGVSFERARLFAGLCPLLVGLNIDSRLLSRMDGFKQESVQLLLSVLKYKHFHDRTI